MFCVLGLGLSMTEAQNLTVSQYRALLEHMEQMKRDQEWQAKRSARRS